MLVTQLIAKLTDAGVRIAAMSNTLPDALGEGRFAAVDFLREIHAMASRFQVVRVDGPDYRHRGLPEAPPPMSDDELLQEAESAEGATLDDFGELCDYLATVHPSRYGRLIEGVSAVYLRGVHAAPDRTWRCGWWRWRPPTGRSRSVSGSRVRAVFEEMLHGGPQEVPAGRQR